jgi:hypothetical protein
MKKQNNTPIQQQQQQRRPTQQPRQAAVEGNNNDVRYQDPYTLLCLPRDFTLQQLKTNYKRLALQLHPDKNLVSPEHAVEVFKILTDSYRKLHEDYLRRTNDLQFHELKAAFAASSSSAPPSAAAAPRKEEDDEDDDMYGPGRRQQQQHQQERQTRKPPPPPPTVHFSTGYDGGFDSDKFNTFFSEHRMTNPNDTGYGDWLRKQKVEEAEVRRRKVEVPKVCQELMLHVDTFVLGRSKLAYSDMGNDEIDDFSISNKCVDATDLRLAYNNRSQTLEDETRTSGLASRREYRDVDELERDRENISYLPNKKGLSAIEEYQQWVDKQEAKRLENLHTADRAAESHFGKLQRMLVGGGGGGGGGGTR